MGHRQKWVPQSRQLRGKLSMRTRSGPKFSVPGVKCLRGLVSERQVKAVAMLWTLDPFA